MSDQGTPGPVTATQEPNAQDNASTNNTPTQTSSPASEDPKTVAAGAEPNTPAKPQTFPDDWRAQIAKDDKDALKRLERFGSVADVWKSYRELEGKLSSGKLKEATQLPANPTPEQLAEFRKANDIPESPEKYSTNLDNGLVVGDNDKPYVDNFLKFAHDNNWTQKQVTQGLNWYFDSQKKSGEQVNESDKLYQIESVEKLKDEWGADYKPNLNRIRGMMDTLFGDQADRFLTSRTSDGRVVGDDPGLLAVLNRLAREIDPAAAVVPGSNNAPQAINDELKNIERMMGDRSSDYWSKDKGPGLQARYRELQEANNKLKSRAA